MGFIDKVKRFFKSKGVGKKELTNLKTNCTNLANLTNLDGTWTMVENTFECLKEYLSKREQAGTLDTTSKNKEGASLIHSYTYGGKCPNSNEWRYKFEFLSAMLILSNKLPKKSKLPRNEMSKAFTNYLTLLIESDELCGFDKRENNKEMWERCLTDKGKQNWNKLEKIIVRDPLKKLNKKLLKVNDEGLLQKYINETFREIDKIKEECFIKDHRPRGGRWYRGYDDNLWFIKTKISIDKDPYSDDVCPWEDEENN